MYSTSEYNFYSASEDDSIVSKIVPLKWKIYQLEHFCNAHMHVCWHTHTFIHDHSGQKTWREETTSKT